MKTNEWSVGPELPHPIAYGSSVPMGDTFLGVAGYYYDNNSMHTSSNKIYEYDPDNDSWITRTETLARASQYRAAFLVPGNEVDCR